MGWNIRIPVSFFVRRGIVECKSEFMVVRIRFGRGPVVTRRRGKNSRIATLAASLLTMASISCASLGLWRVGTDLAWAGGFVFSDGFLSHWQVWIGAAVAIQYLAWRLTQYAGTAIAPEEEMPEATETQAKTQAAANV
jgi:hypothetical protein